MKYKLRQFFGLISVILIAVVASGCAESQRPVATGKGSIRGIAAIADFPDAFFLIEERQIGLTTYKGVAGFNRYDNLSYNFNFDYLQAGDNELTRLTGQFIDVIADTEYTVILTGSVANPETLLWESPARDWDGTETVLEPVFAHLSPALGDVDVYFASLGTPPALGSEVGTLSFGERLTGIDYAEGSYELILTAAGDPANILYSSGETVTAAQTRPMFAIFDPDPSITGPVSVNRIGEGGVSAPLHDPNYPGQLRFYHAAFGTGNVDVYFDGDFSTKIFSDIGFDEASTYVDVPVTGVTMTITAVNNPGAIILENSILITAGTRATIPMVGDPASPAVTVYGDDARPVVTASKNRIVHLGFGLDFVNIYILDPGEEITELTPAIFFAFAAGADTRYFELEAGAHDISIANFGTLDLITPKVTLDVVEGEIIEMAIVNTADPNFYDLSVYARSP